MTHQDSSSKSTENELSRHDSMEEIGIPSEEELTPIEVKNCQVGMWVKGIYEGETFIGKVQQKTDVAIEVRCLEHPFGINHYQEMENDAVFYEKVYSNDGCQPRLEKVGRKWMRPY